MTYELARQETTVFLVSLRTDMESKVSARLKQPLAKEVLEHLFLPRLNREFFAKMCIRDRSKASYHGGTAARFATVHCQRKQSWTH